MLPLEPLQPFALFEDARGPLSSSSPAAPARLLTTLVQAVTVSAPEELEPALEAVRAALRAGLHVGGWLSYEAGLLFEPRLTSLYRAPEGEPLAWFGLFRECRLIDSAEAEQFWRGQPLAPPSPPAAPRIDETTHARACRRVKEYIEAGDVYQINLTFPADVSFEGSPLALYRRLREAQRPPHAACVWTGNRWLLSLSPELFFQLENGRLTARPMKGTAPRRAASAEDTAAAEALAQDEKNRAENLMIVDLLRNDLSRVATPGSVRVPSLFAVETYPTLHQLTSTVEADLSAGLDAIDVIRRLFPCGSITGAPKIRAMEIIRELEPHPRGVYTGSIGWIAPGTPEKPGDACFNVAIRTLLVDFPGAARLGLGSGIVADSTPAAEWQECLLKGRFLTANQPPFDLIETLAWHPVNGHPDSGYARLDRHLARLEQSARYWGFAAQPDTWRQALADTAAHFIRPMRVRLLAARLGGCAVQAAPLPPGPSGPVKVVLADLATDPLDPFRQHKTTHRKALDDTRARLAARTGCFDVLFLNTRGELTEGSFTNIFLERDGELLTPPLASGLLPGVLRAELLETGRAREAVLTPEDLRTGRLFLGNSLRGLMAAEVDSV
ncbi:MAG TPA: aminodeoxychorismate synthase component I [Pedomonas sp.]|uniref:aminodeoxychorismate synthase component I n=1 Tax=Pedomonas sp. TaxID=2976421 RepID=UPI002F408DC7